MLICKHSFLWNASKQEVTTAKIHISKAKWSFPLMTHEETRIETQDIWKEWSSTIILKKGWPNVQKSTQFTRLNPFSQILFLSVCVPLPLSCFVAASQSTRAVHPQPRSLRSPYPVKQQLLPPSTSTSTTMPDSAWTSLDLFMVWYEGKASFYSIAQINQTHLPLDDIIWRPVDRKMKMLHGNVDIIWAKF